MVLNRVSIKGENEVVDPRGQRSPNLNQTLRVSEEEAPLVYGFQNFKYVSFEINKTKQ